MGSPSPFWNTDGSTIGTFSFMSDPHVAEVLGATGFDWVILDLQHGIAGTGGLVSLIQALHGTGTTSLVRVPSSDPSMIGRVLDLGADGVVVPLVETAEQAQLIARACTYPPLGDRSYGPIRSSRLLGDDLNAVNSHVGSIAMIETSAGVSASDEICKTPGIDGILLGTNDLALSMGVGLADKETSPKILEAATKVKESAASAGIKCGITAADGSAAHRRLQEGYDFIAISYDAALLGRAASEDLKAARAEGGS